MSNSNKTSVPASGQTESTCNDPHHTRAVSPPAAKLFTRDFTLVVIGQIISLFGNNILRFALPLYLLRQTGSAALFGLVSACSFLPMIVLSLLGGVIADRLNKRNIMVVLDFFTAAIIIAFSLLLGFSPLVPLMLITLMLLYGINGAYQPAVQASIPALLDTSRVLSGNAIINQISALSGLVGPIVGGWLMGSFGITPILTISTVCFFASAVMELFIRIPYTQQATNGSMLGIVRADLRESFRFIRTGNTVLLPAMLLAAGINCVLSAMLAVGMPVIITTTLGLSDTWMGYCQGSLAAGALLGGICVGLFGKRLTLRQLPAFLLASALALLPIGCVLLLGAPVWISYTVILLCCVCIMACATACSIQLLAYAQTITPPKLIGKVISCMLAVSMCAQPLGQALYGVLFQGLPAGIVTLLAGAASLLICLYARKAFRAIL